MKLVIVGAGPRGLATAIQAVKNEAVTQILLIDPDPYSSWNTDKQVIDFVMRSPVTFDLITGLDESYQDWSLSEYIKTKEEVTDVAFCTRSLFGRYLKYVFHRLNRYKKLSYLDAAVINLEAQHNRLITHSLDVIEYDALVVSIGYDKPKEIKWLDSSKVKDDSYLLNNEVVNQSVLVVGSGQGAAELAVYLREKKNRVTWLLKKQYTVNQYPVPTYDEWQYRTAFSDYYYELPIKEKFQYLKEISTFGPTITPQIANQLVGIKQIVSNKVDLDLSKFDYIFNKAGYELKYENTILKSLPADMYFSHKVSLNKQFRTPLYPIYVTGALATHVGGPNQNSIYSAAFTAQRILEDINATR